MRILVCQMNPIVGSLTHNRECILAGIYAAKEAKVDLVLFPELAICGYPPEDLLLHHDFVEQCEAQMHSILSATKGITAICGQPRRTASGLLRNSAAIMSNGVLLGYHDKVLLPTYDVFDEKRYFEAGNTPSIWDIAGERVAVTICEDIWEHTEKDRGVAYERNPVEEIRQERPDLLVNLSASPFRVDKPLIRANVCCKAAKVLQVPVVMCNQVGANDSLIFDGHSVHADAQGEVVNLGLGFDEQHLVVDTEAKKSNPIASVEETESLYEALVLGIRDYFHKQGFKKACVGLSGGIDSAVVVALATAALGNNHVLGISMPSRYSSEGSRTDAALLANNLGIDLWKLPIEEPFRAYLDLLAEPFSGKRDGCNRRRTFKRASVECY